jgi:hypothetical protein
MPQNRAKRSTEPLRRLPVTYGRSLEEPLNDRVRQNDSTQQYLARVLLSPIAKGTALVTDGPFAETRELLGG